MIWAILTASTHPPTCVHVSCMVYVQAALAGCVAEFPPLGLNQLDRLASTLMMRGGSTPPAQPPAGPVTGDPHQPQWQQQSPQEGADTDKHTLAQHVTAALALGPLERLQAARRAHARWGCFTL
jgi:hypothetical protein